MCGINYLESQLGDTKVIELAAVFDPPRMQRAFNCIGKEKLRGIRSNTTSVPCY